ncbi:hypothetical protein [Pluralibacter gergoviae]|uniref:hypothetical protein n=1 Tax=Pluralibacter gergoviae TaxID=61647 RepID=UPI000AD3D474|nr:hypothetical protein [Pluralibacter gergoviae]ELN2738913.1 hypothetical protein [Pluralibacter gergoviae]
MAESNASVRKETPLVPMSPITANEIRPALAKNPEPVQHERSLTVFDALMPTPKFKTVEGYNPYTLKGEIRGYEMFATDFTDSRSPQETEAIKLKIDARKSVLGVESAGEFKTFMASSAIVSIICILLVTLVYRRLKR